MNNPYPNLNLKECQLGVHPFEKVIVIEATGARGDAAVRWCPQCGTLVIDVERRGRVTSPGGFLRERAPEVTKAALGLVRDSKK